MQIGAVGAIWLAVLSDFRRYIFYTNYSSQPNICSGAKQIERYNHHKL
jgi:hypothetical protein